jgi:hypothetical protein
MGSSISESPAQPERSIHVTSNIAILDFALSFMLGLRPAWVINFPSRS